MAFQWAFRFPIKNRNIRMIGLINKALKSILSAISPVLFVSCAGSANFSTAKMLAGGDVEIAPRVQYEHSKMGELGVANHIIPKYSAGTALTFGVWEKVNFGISGDLLKDNAGGSSNLLMANLKYGIVSNHTAVSIGYGFVSDETIQIAKIAILQNVYLENKDAYFCFSPVVLGYAIADDLDLIDLRFNASFTKEYFGMLKITPEIGTDLLTILINEAVSFNAGISIGLWI